MSGAAEELKGGAVRSSVQASRLSLLLPVPLLSAAAMMQTDVLRSATSTGRSDLVAWSLLSIGLCLVSIYQIAREWNRRIDHRGMIGPIEEDRSRGRARTILPYIVWWEFVAFLWFMCGAVAARALAAAISALLQIPERGAFAHAKSLLLLAWMCAMWPSKGILFATASFWERSGPLGLLL